MPADIINIIPFIEYGLQEKKCVNHKTPINTVIFY